MEMQSLQSMLDRTSIIDLVTRYAVCIDMRRFEDLGNCFVDEIELKLISTGQWIKVSREKLVEIVTRTFVQYDATQHISANHQVELAGERAVCISTLNATHFIANDPDGPIQRQIGYYRYELQRAGEWKICRVEQMLSWQDGNQEIFERAHRDVGLPVLANP